MLNRRANHLLKDTCRSTLAHPGQPNHPPTKKAPTPFSEQADGGRGCGAALVSGDPLEEAAMLQADDEDSRKLFSIRNLDEVEVYFTNPPPPKYRFRLVDKLVRFAVGQGSCPYSRWHSWLATLETMFLPAVEILDDIALRVSDSEPSRHYVRDEA
jgi:hypothetical protein